MGGIEINRSNMRRIINQIIEHIAAAGCNRHHMAIGLDIQRLHVDLRVLPDLRIDQTFKCSGKCSLQQTTARHCLIAMNRFI